ncbi:amidohydrolase family protein [Devosia sp. SD17-2]|uniref:amidohydrolase family protein n=1 Tax=Devosia sp. SD17-2 TaxID=2976459 RepID=UPI0023D889F2|nr:amidohydrolase family protein [Devosia sp. SD17-2]WEJ32805.1 amidohydrolase [Devosia sp. SD17-2]
MAGDRAVDFNTLSAHHPKRLLWASDWPHTEMFEAVPEDDDLIALSLSVVPRSDQAAVFADNAKALYFAH